MLHLYWFDFEKRACRSRVSKGRRLREVHHCGTGGMWMGQDVWCSTSIPSAQTAAHLSSCLQT